MSRAALIMAKVMPKLEGKNTSDKADDTLREYALKSCAKRIATLLKGDVVDADELVDEFTRLHKLQHENMDDD